MLVNTIATILVQGITDWKQYILFNKCKENVKSLIYNNDWKIVDFKSNSIGKLHKGIYRIYIKVLNIKTFEWTNDYIVIDDDGKIIKEDLTDNMKRYDRIK